MGGSIMKFKVKDFVDDFYKARNFKKPKAPKFRVFSKNAEKAACFSGYRAEKFSFDFSPTNPDYMLFEAKLRQVILNTISQGISVFYCGMCYGFDILAGELILEQKALNKDVRLIAVVPFEEQAKNFSAMWRKRYYNLLKASDEVITLQPLYKSGCYERRNQYMANRSSLLICYYDGVKGGTKNMMKYSNDNGLEVINIKTLLLNN